MSRAVMQQALEALEKCSDWPGAYDACSRAVDNLRAALAEPEQPYDQTALDLCTVCGWRTLIPGGACLNCERAKQPEQEPVCDKDPGDCWNVRCQLGKVCKNTAPTPRRPLTYDELEPLCEAFDSYDTTQNELVEFARAIEKAHGITGETK